MPQERATAAIPLIVRNTLPARLPVAPSWILSGVIAGTLAFGSSAGRAADGDTQVQTQQRQYDIPAGALDRALKTFASDAGVMLSADAALTASKSSPGLKGSYTVAQGFAVLLAGSGLQAVEEGAGSYSLKTQPQATASNTAPTAAPTPEVRTLQRIRVEEEEAPDGSALEGYRSNVVSQVGPWEGRALQDLPYSITVIPRELIENLQATTPDQIYRIAPTVQFIRPQYENDQPVINMRGFQASTAYRDGVLGDFFGHGTTTEDVERVEILTGLSGFLYGPGNVGGVINYGSKRPTAERLNRATLGSNGGSNYYAHGDFGGPFDSDGRVGYRVNAVWQDGDTAIDRQSIDKGFISGAIDFHVTDKLLWQFDATYRDYEVRGWQASWLLGPGVVRPSAEDIDTSKSWGQPWTKRWYETQRYGTQLRWDASDAVTLRAAWQFNNTRRSDGVTLNTIQANGTYTQLVFGADLPDVSALDVEFSSHSSQAFADFRFETGAVAHKLTTGVRYRKSGAERFTNFSPGVPFTGANLDRPSYFEKPTLASSNRGPWGRSIDQSDTTLLVGDDISFNERWSLLAGLAHSTIDVNPTYFSPTAGYNESAVTPNVSLIFKPSESLTTYATYIEALEQGGVAGDQFGGLPVVNFGEVMDPLMSEQVEIGAKWSVGGMLLTTALFEIDKGLQYYDISNPAAVRFVQEGRQVHRGVELTAFGKLTNELTLTGGFTLLDAKVKEQRETPALEGKRPVAVAETLVKVRAEYQLPALPALSLSGGISYSSDQYADAANLDRLPGYTLVDIGARYETEITERPLTLRLDVNNVTDKGYWSQGTSLGAPRTVLFSVSTQF